ncbi:MAG: hypothetical protein JOZ72_07860 [Alphaproteobacteria bacterium]|nr:hypothetical protein [Alphaproteobacteria bacterium]
MSTTETSPKERAASPAERAAKKALRKVKGVDVSELERRVLIAELRAREVEAEVRYLVATQTRREMRAGKRDKPKKEKKAGGRKVRADMAD